MTDDGGTGRNALALLWGEVLALAEPVLAARDPWRRARLLRTLGWDLAAVTGDDSAAVQDWVATLEPTLDALRAAVSDIEPDSLDNLMKIGGAAGRALGTLGALPPALRGQGPDLPPGLIEELADDLLDHLVLAYLRDRAPWLPPLLTLLGLVTPATDQPLPSAPLPAGDAPVRLPRRRDEVNLSRLADLLRDPGGYLTDLYAPQGWDTPAGVEVLAGRLMPRLAAALRALGVDAAQGVRPGIGPDQGEAGRRVADGLLRLRFTGPRTPNVHPGLTLGLASWDGRLTALLAPTGEVDLTGSVGSWNVAAELTGTAPAIAVNSAGVTFDGDASELRFAAELARIAPPDEAGWIFGAPDGTHLALGQLVLRAKATLGTGRDDIELLASVGRAELVVKAGDADGLLRKLLPADGLRIAFDLGVGWSLRAGLHLAGAGALTAEYPLHLSAWGLHLEGLRIALTGDTQSPPNVGLAVTTTLRATLGPIEAVLFNLGVRADLTFPPALPAGSAEPEGGNLGVADLVPRFKLPDGLGLSVDNGIVSGGGFLHLDDVRGMYAGALALGVTAAGSRGFNLQVLAVVNTKNADGTRLTEADGSRTFSMLAVGSLRWYPGLMLFWGISITGLGLVVGHNRRGDPEELSRAARGGTLEQLMFPDNVIGRAPQILTTLSRVFPVDPTGTVVGAMVRLTFLSGQVTADLAVLVEFPEPIRIMLLGRLVIDLKPAGRFQLDAAGVYEVTRQQVRLDAGLVDSRLFGRPVSGEMALRAGWGADKHFAVSIGGFHPDFAPPAGFPALKRFTIALLKNAKGITAEAYLAATLNTAQFGGRVLLKYDALGFDIDGRAWLDVMFQFKPFWFTASIGAHLTIARGGSELLVLTAMLAVSGPGPWVVKAEVRFKLLFIDVSARVDWTDALSTVEEEPRRVDATAMFRDALVGPQAWEIRPGPASAEAVTLRQAEDAGPAALLLSPGATLAVRQNVFPLGVDMQRVGTSRIDGAKRFTITGVTVGDGAATGGLGEQILDDFAPGQFRDLSPEERVSVPGFERLPAGVTVSLPDGTALPDAALTVLAGLDGDEAYDRVIIDHPDDAGRPMPAQPATARAGGTPPELLALFAATGPAANAHTRSRFTGAGLGLGDAGPTWVPGRGAARPAGRAAVRAAADALPSATEALAVAPGGDRARRIRRRGVAVAYPTIAPAGKRS